MVEYLSSKKINQFYNLQEGVAQMIFKKGDWKYAKKSRYHESKSLQHHEKFPQNQY